MTTTNYMQRLGAELAKEVGVAVGTAIGPLATGLDTDRKKGLEDLVQQFLESLRGSAGEEMTTLAEVLKTTTDTLKNLRQDLADSGNRFAGKMGEASAAFAELVKRAGGDLGRTTEGGRAAIEESMKALVRAGEDMRRQLEENASKAGQNAASVLDGALKEVLGNLSAQMQAFQTALTGFQRSLAESGQRSAGEARDVLDRTTKAAGEAAQSVRDTFAELLQRLREDAGRLSTSMATAEQTFSNIAGAARETVQQSNVAASAFGRVAESVDKSSRPLLDAAARIEGSVGRMTDAVTRASQSVATSNEAATKLAQSLKENMDALERTWRSFTARFEGVDESLAGAIRTLSEETEQYKRRLKDFVVEVDKDFARSVKSLEGIATTLTESAEEISENLEALVGRLDEKV
jgi:ABC-type transporter Mla subunit MlaD